MRQYLIVHSANPWTPFERARFKERRNTSRKLPGIAPCVPVNAVLMERIVKFTLKERPSIYEWHDWFAWHPVTAGNKVIWLEMVRRKVTEYYCGTEYEYEAVVSH